MKAVEETSWVGGEEIEWFDEPESMAEARLRMKSEKQEMREKYNLLISSRRDEWSIAEVSELLAYLQNAKDSTDATIKKFHKSTPQGTATEEELYWYHGITKAFRFYLEASKRTQKILNLMYEDARQKEARERKKHDRERVVMRRMLGMIKARGLISEEVLDALRREVGEAYDRGRGQIENK
jgi:hypothetical protein